MLGLVLDVEDTRMNGCRPINTPMDPNVKLLLGQGEPLSIPEIYWWIIRKLNFVTLSRPDISFLVSLVSQFMNSPCNSHWEEFLHVLWYINSDPGKGLLYDDQGHERITGYTDIDWAGSPFDRGSTSEYCDLVGGNLVSWKSKKQSVVARFSAELEYRAMAATTCEPVWIKKLLGEINFGKKINQMELVFDCYAPSLHPTRGRHSMIIAGLEKTLGLTYLT